MKVSKKMISIDELEEQGWTKQNVYSGERLNDVIESYEETGFEVMTLPAVQEDLGCDVCWDPTLQVVYTRPKKQEAGLEELF